MKKYKEIIIDLIIFDLSGLAILYLFIDYIINYDKATILGVISFTVLMAFWLYSLVLSLILKEKNKL